MSPIPHNEGKYTNLGLVTKGREIVKNLAKFDRVLKTRVIVDRSPRKPGPE